MEYRKGSCLYRYIHVLPWILRYKPNILNEIIFYLWMLCIVVFAAKTGKFLTSDLKGVHSTFTNRGIFVYIFCFIRIGLSLSGEGIIKWNLWILKEHNYNNFNYLWKFEPDIPNSFGEILFENPQNLQRMYKLNVLPPSNFAVFNCCYFLCYWLKRAETCKNCIK